MSNDLSILGPPASLRPALLDFDDTICTGAYKLVQRVLVILFTDEDNPYSFGIGTEIPQLLVGTNAVDDDTFTGYKVCCHTTGRADSRYAHYRGGCCHPSRRGNGD